MELPIDINIERSPSPAVMQRALKVLCPELAQELTSKITPLSSEKSLIETVYASIISKYTDLDRTDTCILFTAVVYRIYAPAVFLGEGFCKLPIGIRDEAARVSGFISPEMINYFLEMAKVYVTRPYFEARVKDLIEEAGLNYQDLNITHDFK